MKKKKDLLKPRPLNINDLLQIVEIRNDGIVKTKSGYFALIEVPTVNFTLMSEREQNYIISMYEAFLKTIKTPFLLFTIAKKADAKAHIDFMEEQARTENNENVKAMIAEYQAYVRTVSYRRAVRKRYVIAIPYVPPAGMAVTEIGDQDIQMYMEEKKAQFRNGLKKCGNEVEVPDDEQYFASQVLFELANIKSSEKERMVKL